MLESDHQAGNFVPASLLRRGCCFCLAWARRDLTTCSVGRSWLVVLFMEPWRRQPRPARAAGAARARFATFASKRARGNFRSRRFELARSFRQRERQRIGRAVLVVSTFDSRSDHANEVNVTIAVTEDHMSEDRHHMEVITPNSWVT